MIRISLCLLLFSTILQAQNTPVDLEVNPIDFHDLKLSPAGDAFEITTTGKDPYIFLKPLKTSLDKNNNYLSFEYFCPTGVDFVEVYFYPLNVNPTPLIVRDVGSTEGWVEFKVDISSEIKDWGKPGDYLRLDFGAAPNLNIQIKNLKLRSMTEREREISDQKEVKKQEEALLEANIRKYLDTNFQSTISKVLVKENEIIITGTIPGGKKVFLREVPVYGKVTEEVKSEFNIPLKITKNAFKISIDRYITRDGFKQDRLLSKWVLVEKGDSEKYSLSSHARYTDSVVPKYNYNFIKPTNIKGLGGYSAGREAPVSDLDDLGITSVTVNLWINQLFRATPSKENMAFEYLDRTYYVNKEALRKFDETLLTTAARNIEVSLILLVSKANQSPDKELGRILQHPDTDPSGIYSMPNVTTAEGVQYYSAILDFLAARYSRPDKKYGRVHHYIIHNEVDAGWVWTNVGDKTSLVFMDLYHKSMRMTHNIARNYHSQSKVFISLTHYWNWTSNPKFYHSKELLEQLLDFSRAEGDFEWAIAQHPYPESLREPKTWLDNKVSFDFDTQLITFKNIEVLAAWVKQPEVLFQGKKRRMVYLSENGTNSPTYSEQDLKEQAAGMAYAMKKIKFLDGIDGFQYHNWQDNRKEGGLRIGLRRFPDDVEYPGGIKPVWKVYQAYGTPEEDEVYDQYKEIIGISSWDEIRYKGEIGKKKTSE